MLRFLEEHGRSEYVEAVTRGSSFEAELKFDTEAHAAALVADLSIEGGDSPQPLREAVVRLDVDGTTVKLEFDQVGEPLLHGVGPDHETACILHGAVLGE